MGFDFGRISDVVSKVMDTDYIDIQRDVGGSLQEVYSNIPCHIAYSSVDNPDPTSVDIKPIIQSLTIHCQLWVDIRNNDFIIAKKVGSDGSLIAVYSGRCGNPVVSQGRKKVLVTMSATEPEEPTPLPPPESVTITVRYLADGEEIQEERRIKAEPGKPFELEAPLVEGYSAIECYVDGEFQESTTARVPEVSKNGNEIAFVYSETDSIDYFRFLVNGLFTRDNGSISKGWHQYKIVRASEISNNGNAYTVTCDDVTLVHADNGKELSIDVGAKIVLYPGAVFAVISKIVSRENGSVTFNADSYIPTEAEADSYVCGWYD